MLILFAALLAIDQVLLSGDAFSGINPNPYWLPVLVLAMTYGTGMGLSAAFIATVIWLSAPHSWEGEIDHLGTQLRLSVLPMLWMVVALAVGEVTAGRKAQIAGHERRYQTMERNWEKMADSFARLAKTNRTLQIRIATEERTVGRAIAAALGLAEPRLASKIGAVARLISLAAQTEDFTYYDVQGTQVVARFCGKAAISRPSDLSRTDLAQSMIANPALLHSGRAKDRETLAHLGIVALPIRNEASGQLAALLLIHASRRLRLTEAKIAELSHLAESLGKLSILFGSANSLEPESWHIPEGKVA